MSILALRVTGSGAKFAHTFGQTLTLSPTGCAVQTGHILCRAPNVFRFVPFVMPPPGVNCRGQR